MTNVNAFRTGDSDGIVRDPYKMYIGVGAVPKDIVSIYVGTPGGVQQCWDNKIPKPEYITIDSHACLRLTDESKRATHCRVILDYGFGIPTQTFEIPIASTKDVSINLINIQEYDDIISGVMCKVSVTLYDSTGYFTPYTKPESSGSLGFVIRERSGGLRFERSLYKPSETLTMDRTGMFEYRESDNSTVACSTFVVNDVGVWYGNKQAYDFASGKWLLPSEINIAMPWYISEELDNWLTVNAM